MAPTRGHGGDEGRLVVANVSVEVVDTHFTVGVFCERVYVCFSG